MVIKSSSKDCPIHTLSIESTPVGIGLLILVIGP